MFSKKYIFLSLIFSNLFLFNSNAYALPFNITPKAGTILPTNIVPGRSAVAFYTVQNNTQSARNNNFVKSLPPNVTQTTNGGIYSDTCKNTFNLSPAGQQGDSCTLQLSITGSVDVNSQPNLLACFPGGVTCAGTPYQLNVSEASQLSIVSLTVSPAPATLYQGATQQFSALAVFSDNSTADITASTTWTSSNSSVATISPQGIATANHIGSTVITAKANGIANVATLNVVSTPVVNVVLSPNITTTNYPFDIVFSQSGVGSNTLSAILPNGMSYVGADKCTVSETQTSCRLKVNSGNINGSYPISAQLISGTATLSPSNPLTVQVTAPLFLYVSDYSNKLNKCPINPADGTFISNCIPLLNQGPHFSHTSAIAFNGFTGQNYAYIGDASTHLWQCPLNSDGNFSAGCSALVTSGTPDDPTFVSTRNTVFHTFGSSTFAYISDDSMYLRRCSIDSATGAITLPCDKLTVSADTSSEIYQTTFATFSGTTYAYIGDHSYGMWICQMDATSGGFSGPCATFINSPPFTATIGITFNTFNGKTYAYVSDDSTNVWQCPIKLSDGTINGYCAPLSNPNQPFFHTTAVSFKTFSGTTYAYLVDQTNAMWRCPVDTTTGAFSSSCVSINSSHFTGDALGASFYTP